MDVPDQRLHGGDLWVIQLQLVPMCFAKAYWCRDDSLHARRQPRYEHRELCVFRLQRSYERDDPGPRYEHRVFCVLRLQQSYERDDPGPRYEHRVFCVLRLQRSYERDDPEQRNEHRIFCVLRLQRVDVNISWFGECQLQVGQRFIALHLRPPSAAQRTSNGLL